MSHSRLLQLLQKSTPLPAVLAEIALGYSLPPEECVAGIYAKNTIAQAAKEIARYCLELLDSKESNGVANALSELKEQEQQALFVEWEKIAAQEDEPLSPYKLLVVYYQSAPKLKKKDV